MEFNGKKLYHGDIHDGDKYRREYIESYKKLLERKLKEGRAKREDFMPPEKLVNDSEFYRNEYLKMIGFPFDLVTDKIPNVKEEYVGEDDMCSISRLSIEVADDFFFYGILMKPHGVKKAPLVVAQHGGGGTPEYCSDMWNENNYNFFTKRALEQGFFVFAPSLMLWTFSIDTGEKFPTFDIPSNRKETNDDLKHIGYTITGFEVFCIMRSIDWLCAQDFIDETRIGMMGLSYGGYFSLHTAAADTRIIAAYDAASFNDRDNVFLHDWRYYNGANLFHDAEVAALCAPRRLLIDVGKTDKVFDYSYSSAEAERIYKYYKAYGAEHNFRFNLWDGEHRFDTTLNGFEYFFEALRKIN